VFDCSIQWSYRRRNSAYETQPKRAFTVGYFRQSLSAPARRLYIASARLLSAIRSAWSARALGLPARPSPSTIAPRPRQSLKWSPLHSTCPTSRACACDGRDPVPHVVTDAHKPPPANADAFAAESARAQAAMATHLSGDLCAITTERDAFLAWPLGTLRRLLRRLPPSSPLPFACHGSLGTSSPPRRLPLTRLHVDTARLRSHPHFSTSQTRVRGSHEHTRAHNDSALEAQRLVRAPSLALITSADADAV
jgi:hypothetical protein